MILPESYLAALLLSILSMLCWGSWANTYKLTKRWRFELFYFDFAAGVLVASIVAAFTLGSFGEGFTVVDNLLVTGRTQMVQAIGAGVIFNLANMLLVAAISITGLAIAFPIGIGLALVIGTIWSYALNPQGNATMVFAGALLVTLAIVVDAMAYRAHGTAKAPFRIKGVLISLVSGVLMGSFYPLVEMSKKGEIGLGPYAIALLFAIGVFLSTFVFNIYFMNLPVTGEPVGIAQYFRGGMLQNHLLGLLGGAVWCVGAISNFAAASAPKEVNVGPAISYALGQGATMVSVLWGLIVWREFAGATVRVKGLILAMMALFLAGLGLISIAPLFA